MISPALEPIREAGQRKGKTRTRVSSFAGRAPLCGDGC